MYHENNKLASKKLTDSEFDFMSNIPPDSGKPSTGKQATSGAHGTSPQTSSGVHISSTSILPLLAKDINTGDLINFTVRGRTPEGMGILYLLGQLVQARIPDHLQTGDRVQARIGYENEQILFRILSVTGKDNKVPAGTGQQITTQQNPLDLAQSLQRKVEEMLFTISRFLPNSQGTIPTNIAHNSAGISSLVSMDVPAEGHPISQLKDILHKLFEVLPSHEEMTQSATFLPKLQELFKVSTNETIKAVSLELKAFLNTHDLPPEQRFLLTLFDQLQSLSSDRATQSLPKEIFRLSLEKIIHALEQEISKDTKAATGNISKEAYQTTLKVSLSLLKEAYIHPESKSDATGKVLDYIQNNLAEYLPKHTESESPVPVKILGEIKTLITTLEQFTYTQEMLLRLEPILQAMRQPELLLFPFLFQGLFSFGELLVDPDARRSPSDKGKKDTDNKDREADAQMIQYQAMLPLPHIGTVRFNTLQSSEEITLDLSFEDQEKAAFVEAQIHDLREELMKLGFTKLEISARSDNSNLLKIEGGDIKVV
jgi:hypothetical protein